MKHTLPLALLLAALAGPARAGPPAICWQVEIADAKSLPWGQSDFTKEKRYDPGNVVADTLNLLGPDTPILVRMETIRRAVLYIDRQIALRDALMGKLMKRVLDAEAAGRPPALAWFDAGYARGCFEQVNLYNSHDGYRWVRHAVRLQGDDPSMQYACALLTLMGDHPGHKNYFDHVARATAGAAKDPLLKKNLELLAKLSKPVLRYFENLERREQQKQNK
ncbi:MAG: hypothetical protein ACYTFD_04905 [Planctomycetota bacterium]|jgi:hypothetical protein